MRSVRFVVSLASMIFMLAVFQAAAASAAPTVLSVAPSSGLTTQTTAVTVRGQGFVSGSTTVKFGANSATNVVVNSSSELTATAPAGAAGLVDVTATTSAGTSPVYNGAKFTYGTSTPSALELDGATATKVAFQWAAPALPGITGYTIYRGGTQIATTDAYTTNFVDTGRTANTQYSYTVTAQTISGSTAASSALVVTTAATSTTISQCSATALGSGHYIVTANLTTASGSCINFANASNITLECQNGATLSQTADAAVVWLASVQHFFITGCNIQPSGSGTNVPMGIRAGSSSFGTISGNTFVAPASASMVTGAISAPSSASIAIAGNTFQDAEVFIDNTTDSSVHDNTGTIGLRFVYGAQVLLTGGARNVVDHNTFDGGAPPHVNSGNGADDGVVLNPESNSIVVNNTLSHFWDMGIETTGQNTNCQIVNNNIDYAQIAAIGAFARWNTSWFGNLVSGNTATHSGSLLNIGTGNVPSGATATYFQYNTFSGNAASQDDLQEAGVGGLVNYSSKFSGAESGYHVVDFAGNNTITNNKFGSTRPAPLVSGVGSVTESGNFCQPPGPGFTSTTSYQTLACDGYTASAPVVSGVAPASASTDGGTTVTVTGSGFLSANELIISAGTADWRSRAVPNCATPGVSTTTCFTVSSDNTLTFPTPLSTQAFAGHIRVSSDVNGTGPVNASDGFTFVSPVTLGIQITNPPNNGVMWTDGSQGYFQLTVTGGSMFDITDQCTLFDVTTNTQVSSWNCSWTYYSGAIYMPQMKHLHQYQLTATAVDTYGDSATSTAAFTAKDFTKPVVSITSPSANQSVIAPVTTTFTATDPGSGVASTSCKVVDTTTSTTVSDASCTSGATLSGLTPGDSFALTVSATDGAGNVGTATQNFNVAVAPVITMTSPTQGFVSPTGNVVATFSVNVAASTTCSWDGAAPASCASGSTSPFLANGTHTLVVTATAGSQTTSTGTITFSVDGPTAVITYPANGSLLNTRSITPAFSGIQSGSSTGFTYTCKLDAAAAASCSSSSPPTYTNVADGSHTLTVVATYSNGYSATAASTFTVDATPPTAVIDTGPTSPTNNRTPQFTFHSTEANSTLECNMDSAAWAGCTSPYTSPTLSGGPHTFYVRAKDAAGNYSPAVSWPFTVVVPGTLTSSNATFSSSINLATQGTLDWAHWGSSSTTPTAMDHKANVTSLIGGLATAGGGTFARITGVSPTSTWSGGVAPNTSSNSTTQATGLSVSGSGKGYSLTAAASDTTTRTLRLYIGALNTTATVNLTLSDGSATIANSTFSSTLFTTSKIYTITYKAGSPGASLTAKVTASSGGTVRLYSATLQ